MKPWTEYPSGPSQETSSMAPAVSAPYTDMTTSERIPFPGVARALRPSTLRLNRIRGKARANRATRSLIRERSDPGDRRNFRRAGTFSNRDSTLTDVPTVQPAGPLFSTSPQRSWTSVPTASEAGRLVIITLDTDATLGSASPRKPIVVTDSRSSGEVSLLVAWRWKESRISSAGIPQPSSVTLMRSTPPPLISMSIRLAPASMEFSTNSLTTDAGRSTTSPAAILAATSGFRTLIVIPTVPAEGLQGRPCG